MFTIKNRSKTFVTIKLNGQDITLTTKANAGPFAENMRSRDLYLKEFAGDVVTISCKPPSTKKKEDKKINKSEDKSDE